MKLCLAWVSLTFNSSCVSAVVDMSTPLKRFHLLPIKRACNYISPSEFIRAPESGRTAICCASVFNCNQERQKTWSVARFNSAFHGSGECLVAVGGNDTQKSNVDGTTKQRADSTPESAPGPPPEARTIRGSPVSWLSLGLLVATGAGLIFYFDQEKKRHIEAFRQNHTESKPGPGVGKAAIGGPFKLINHEGKQVTDTDFKGNWNLLYFGFTHCPDICPDELQKMVEAIDAIEKREGLSITPVFISVDPERDNVEQVREYVKEFHPRLIGLTGSANEIRQVAREYRVYYMKTEEEGSDYLVDHSIIMYLMDPEMEFVKFFGKNYDVHGLANGVIEEIKRHKKATS